MRKALYIGILILMILIAFLALRNATTSQTVPTEDQFASFPEDIEPIDPQSQRLELKTTEGNLTVRNFLQDPATFPDTSNEGYYQLGHFIDPGSETPPAVPFSVEFTSDSQHFIVVLMQEDVADARSQAEQFMLRHLGVSEEELCTISHMVSVPARFNSPYAGRNLGFSFCPGSVSFE